jgi:hypothetical protein
LWITDVYNEQSILNCEISHEIENEKYIRQKLTKFSQTLGILNNTFKQNFVQKCSRIKVYNALTLPIILYGSEIWALKKKKG